MTMTMMPPAPPKATIGELQAEVTQFYAEHFQLLDAGDAEGWAATFTEDGWFWPPSIPQPITGRAALEAGVRKAQAHLAEIGEQHRHWHGMVAVKPCEDRRSVVVRCYALILATPHGGEPRPHLSCVCNDLLVSTDDGWKVAERVVERDGDPNPPTGRPVPGAGR